MPNLPTQSRSTETQPPFRLDDLRTAVGGDNALAGRVAVAFINVKVELRDRLTKAARGRDATTLASAAHELKGMASMIGARQLAALAAQLDARARAGDVGDAESTLSLIEKEWDAVARALAPAVAGF